VRLHPARLSAHGDHRLAMAWAVAASLVPNGEAETVIDGAEAVTVSYPQFFDDLRRLTG
jgi:3-phosphoshikimate 1-carboxyvinyltransferase